MSWRGTALVARTFRNDGLRRRKQFANHPVYSNPSFIKFQIFVHLPPFIPIPVLFRIRRSVYAYMLLKIVSLQIYLSSKTFCAIFCEICEAIVKSFNVYLLVLLCFTKLFQDANLMPTNPFIFAKCLCFYKMCPFVSSRVATQVSDLNSNTERFKMVRFQEKMSTRVRGKSLQKYPPECWVFWVFWVFWVLF